MSRGPDAGTLLERRLCQVAAGDGVAIEIVSADWERWASATFSGARHRLSIRLPERDGAWLDTLGEAELPLRGHLVADVTVTSRARQGDALLACIEALTVEEG